MIVNNESPKGELRTPRSEYKGAGTNYHKPCDRTYGGNGSWDAKPPLFIKSPAQLAGEYKR